MDGGVPVTSGIDSRGGEEKPPRTAYPRLNNDDNVFNTIQLKPAGFPKKK